MKLLRTIRIIWLPLAASLLSLAACGPPAGQAPPSGQATGPNQGQQPTELMVMASFYPLQWLTQQVCGPDFVVGSLTPPGAEPHEAELTPAQVAKLGQSDLLVTLGGFQPAVDLAVTTNPPGQLIDARSALSLEGADPHFWLDPTLLAQLAEAIANQLSLLDPDGAAGYANRARVVAEQLTQLDLDLQTGLEQLHGATLASTHAAFGYLALRYQLNLVSISGLDPEQEPSPARLRQVRAELAPLGITTVFSESPLSDQAARALAAELGASVVRLDPLETTPSGGDYLSAMRANLEALQAGLVRP